jgi:transglutaminase-like putative cysteine protease
MITLKPMRYCALILCLSLLQSYCSAQDKSNVQFGKVSPADFTLPSSPIIDSNTNAVILSNIGSLHYVGNEHGWFSYVFKKQIRIKILNKKAFDLATVRIPLYAPEDHGEKLSNVTAATYSLENGEVTVNKLDPRTELFNDRKDKSHLETKFTMPAVKEGSIIEYTYTITSEYNFNIPSWEFQSEEAPCLWSEYQIAIPQTLLYIFVRQGTHAYAVDKGGEGHESYKVMQKTDHMTSIGSMDNDLNVSVNTVLHRWAMKDVPAFHEERYLSTPANYIDKIDFQLSKTYDGQEYHDQMNNWSKATEQLLKSEDFGLPLSDDNEWLNAIVEKIVPATFDAMEQARSIYYYVANHFTCTNHHNKYITTSLHDVVKKNSGSVGDINLLLIAMLRKRGLKADPVLLGTRDVGFNLVSYPMMERLTYVVARLKLSGRVYYLDAAHPELGFGQLPSDCYNGHARIISETDSGSVYFEADSLKEKKVTMVLLSYEDKGLEGSCQSTLGTQESYRLRRKVSEKGEKAYFKDIQTAYGEDMDISNTGIDSLLKTENPVKVHYDFHLNQAAGTSVLYFNPMFWEGWRENPFKAVNRKYPVEMPYTIDELYIFSMAIPDGYVVDELPKSAKVAFNGDQGSFEYMLAHEGDLIQLRCRLKLNKAWFAPDDYGSLRDFFAYVVKKESEQIVLKKK